MQTVFTGCMVSSNTNIKGVCVADDCTRVLERRFSTCELRVAAIS